MKKPKIIKGWAVTLPSDGYFIPDFSVNDLVENILQIHSCKKSAEKAIKLIGKKWEVKRVEIKIIN